jgi:pimeloyl-ACP methyl ester carboxylesterase
VVLVAAPMDATSFAPLADLLASDHTVLTTDPRGINRSPVDDPNLDSTPPMRADDLSRLLAHRAERHAGNEEVIDRWLAGDYTRSWKAFLDNAGIQLPEGVFEATFAQQPDPQAIADTSYQNSHMLRPTTHFRPDIAALRSAATPGSPKTPTSSPPACARS